MSDLTHEELAQRLVRWLEDPREANRLTWTNLSFLDNGREIGVRRPDVVALVKTLNPQRLAPTVYEVKVSRADFLADIRGGKWQSHLRYSSRMYFATPENLVHPKEVPDPCGLIECTPEGFWRTKKRAKTRKWAFSDRDYLRLILGRWNTKPFAPAVT